MFFLQVQGSGRVKLTDGSIIRIHYDGKNGHPYSSIGRYLIEKGLLAADKVSMGALKRWLKADPERAKQVLWQNASYVFFRELKGPEANGPLGAMNAQLTPGRSLAVDTSHHALGLPIYVSGEGMTHVDKAGAFNRLMIAQDVGSAIKGPERGDIYFGSGDAAGRLAGVTKHAGQFIVLLPKETPARAEAAPGQAGAGESPAMSGAGRKSGGGRRTITADEAELWEHATRSLEPVKAKPRVASAALPRPNLPRVRRRPLARASATPARAEPIAGTREAERPGGAQEPKAPRRRSPTSTAARPGRSPPARSRSRRASICTGCASATPTRACAPSCSRPTPRASRRCWSSPARAARSPPTGSATSRASGSAACSAATSRTGWRSPSCGRSCSASPRPASATAAPARSTCSCARGR